VVVWPCFLRIVIWYSTVAVHGVGLLLLQVAQSFAPRLKRGLASGDKQQLLEVRRQAAAMMTMVYQQ
jgi:hypothetical protein